MSAFFIFTAAAPLGNLMSIIIDTADYANSEHQQQLRTLMNIYASDPMGGGTPLAEEVLQNLPKALQQCGNAFTLIARQNDHAVALLTGFETLSTFKAKPLINIHDVVVHPDFRRQGIARQLFAACEQRAKQRGCCKITLEVLTGNSHAQALYRQLGFDDYSLDPDAGTALFWQKEL